MADTACENQWPEEACYWLPREPASFGPTQSAIIDQLSMLLWIDAPEARWANGGIVEHADPPGYGPAELAWRIYRSTPTWRQVRIVEKSLAMLIGRGVIEPCIGSRGRYRLRGWNCLHTRRRTTRRSIEHGGGRALYFAVRFSA